MSWLFSRALVEAYSPGTSLVGAQSAPWSVVPSGVAAAAFTAVRDFPHPWHPQAALFMNHEFSDDAIDALVAASLRQAYSSDAPTEASIAAAIKAAAVEEPEDAARLQRIRERLATSTSQPIP